MLHLLLKFGSKIKLKFYISAPSRPKIVPRHCLDPAFTRKQGVINRKLWCCNQNYVIRFCSFPGPILGGLEPPTIYSYISSCTFALWVAQKQK